ncbi:MAG: DivIVA domain-containing protein [Clostridiales bacterium]|nr:DivIVA domain-containing protein [Clostridiales bacterium]
MQNQKITIEEIENKEFHIASRGYNQHEVDEFLDSICDELERQEAEINALKAENDRLQHQAVPQPFAAPVVPAPVAAAPVEQMNDATEGTFREILEMAKRVKDMTIADAKAKAAEIVANAENEAKARLGNMDEEKKQLEAELESVKTAVREYKEKFAEAIAMAQDALDLTTDL